MLLHCCSSLLITFSLPEVPEGLTCTQLPQLWHVTITDELDEPILHEDINFKKASCDKNAMSGCIH